jgi:hypothetical protein
MKTFKKLWEFLRQILGHPMWNGLSCLIAFIATFGLAGIIISWWSKFPTYYDQLKLYLIEPVIVPRFFIVLGSIFIIWAFVSIIFRGSYRRLSKLKSKIFSGSSRTGDYYRYWSVLWKPVYSLYEDPRLSGPYCPKHYLEMPIQLDENSRTYSFYCDGGEGKSPHVIRGPHINDLIKPKERRTFDDPIRYIKYDVMEQIQAEKRKSEAAY